MEESNNNTINVGGLGDWANFYMVIPGFLATMVVPQITLLPLQTGLAQQTHSQSSSLNKDLCYRVNIQKILDADPSEEGMDMVLREEEFGYIKNSQEMYTDIEQGLCCW